VRRLEAAGERYDAMFLLQPTNPLRTPGDIDGAVALLERTGADSVISFVDTGKRHPALMKVIDDSGRVTDPPFAEPFEGMASQQLPKLYLSLRVGRRWRLVCCGGARIVHLPAGHGRPVS